MLNYSNPNQARPLTYNYTPLVRQSFATSRAHNVFEALTKRVGLTLIRGIKTGVGGRSGLRSVEEAHGQTDSEFGPHLGLRFSALVLRHKGVPVMARVDWALVSCRGGSVCCAPWVRCQEVVTEVSGCEVLVGVLRINTVS